jgi:hypothetical protein
MRPVDPQSAAAVGAAICLVVPLVAVPASMQTTIGYPRLMQGPMVWAVTPTEALIWVRTTGKYPLTIEYGTDPELTFFRSTGAVVARKANCGGGVQTRAVLVHGKGRPGRGGGAAEARNSQPRRRHLGR